MNNKENIKISGFCESCMHKDMCKQQDKVNIFRMEFEKMINNLPEFLGLTPCINVKIECINYSSILSYREKRNLLDSLNANNYYHLTSAEPWKNRMKGE